MAYAFKLIQSVIDYIYIIILKYGGSPTHTYQLSTVSIPYLPPIQPQFIFYRFKIWVIIL